MKRTVLNSLLGIALLGSCGLIQAMDTGVGIFEPIKQHKGVNNKWSCPFCSNLYAKKSYCQTQHMPKCKKNPNNMTFDTRKSDTRLSALFDAIAAPHNHDEHDADETMQPAGSTSSHGNSNSVPMEIDSALDKGMQLLLAASKVPSNSASMQAQESAPAETSSSSISNNKRTLTKADKEGQQPVAKKARIEKLVEPEYLLTKASSENNFDRVKCLLDAKADSNERDAQGKTALMYAVHHKSAPIVLALLQAKADVRIADAAGKTAMNYLKDLGENDPHFGLLNCIMQAKH